MAFRRPASRHRDDTAHPIPPSALRTAEERLAGVEADVPPIGDDAGLARAASILRALQDGAERVRRESDALAIEWELASFSPASDGPRRSMMRERAKMLRRRLAEGDAGAPAEDASDMPPAVKRALRLLDDGRVDKIQDIPARQKELSGHAEVFDAALRAQGGLVEGIRRDLSEALARRLRDQHWLLLREEFHAAEALSAATDRERAFRAKIMAAGYQWRPDLTPRPAVRSTLTLGTTASYDSEITTWRRILEQQGIL